MNPIGERIKLLREHFRLSQEDLAKFLQIDRTIISNIERGKRALKSEEILLLSNQLNISIPQLLGNEPLQRITSKVTQIEPEPFFVKSNSTTKNIPKFKEALIYILKKIGSKPNIGITVIYKLLYFIDFNHYEKYEEYLMGMTYIKNTHGPTPTDFTINTNEMLQKNEIEKINTTYYTKPQIKYLACREPNIHIFSAPEIKTIDDVVLHLSDMTAFAISDYSHKDIPWLVAEEGKEIDYESVFYRTPAYSVREDEHTIPNGYLH